MSLAKVNISRISFIALSLLFRIHTYKINKIACLAKHYSDHEHRGLPVSKMIFFEKSLSVHILCVCLSVLSHSVPSQKSQRNRKFC